MKNFDQKNQNFDNFLKRKDFDLEKPKTKIFLQLKKKIPLLI